MVRNAILAGVLLVGAASLTPEASLAQGPPNRPQPANAKVGAPVDLTGQWVSVVTEDWRWRMVTPPKGDYASVPLTAAGRAKAMAWDLAADNAAGRQCAAFGAGGVMRMPTRIRISWQDDNTLKLETDAGQQVQLLKFVAPGTGPVLPALTAAGPPPAQRTWQGESKAQWVKLLQSSFIGGGPGPGGSLQVVTRNMRAGYLRKNGAPYSENAVITSHFVRHDEPGGDSWITVVTIVNDPENLREPFVTSSAFKKEKDTSKWAPSPCNTPAPLETPAGGPPRDAVRAPGE